MTETMYSNCLTGVAVWLAGERTRLLIERYEQLIRVMQALSPHARKKHFDMRNWGQRTDCGTTMCAAGFAGSDPWFRKQGFKFYKDRDEGVMTVKYQDEVGWDAISDFFGMLADEHSRGIAPRHQVFMLPRSVDEVIAAARARIAILSPQS